MRHVALVVPCYNEAARLPVDRLRAFLTDDKSVGLVLAQAVLRKASPDWGALLETPDSFFIGADVFYTFLVQNGLWWVKQRQKDPDHYLDVLLSDSYGRGEMQVIGRNETAIQASWQATPLFTTDFLTIWNMNDGSFLLSPAAIYSVSNEVYVRGGFFFGIGANERRIDVPIVPEEPQLVLPGSEYGIVPSSLYVSLTAFF